MGFTGAHMLYVLDVFILALYLLSHVCALLEYTFQSKNIVWLNPLKALSQPTLIKYQYPPSILDGFKR